MFYLSNVAIAVNISQPSVRIGGGLHALIHIFFYTGGLKAPNQFGTLSLIYYTPGSGEHGPRFLTGGPGAAPGGVASKNGWVYMRVQRGVISYSLACPKSVCCYKTAVGVENGLRERLRVCRGGSRNQLRGLKEGGSARRGAMLCLPADLTPTPFQRFNGSPCRV